MWGRSVVCNSYADGGVIATNDAQQERRQALRQLDPLAFEGIASDVMDPAPAKWLLDHGIQRIVVGHKPTGDCPAVGGTQALKRFGDSRGNALAIVEITGESFFCTRLETSGVLACGTEYRNKFPFLGIDGFIDGGDPYLGTRLPGGWWVKAAVPPNYHLCRGSGRFVEYKVQPMRDVIKTFPIFNV